MGKIRHPIYGIDPKGTGRKLKRYMIQYGYNVKELQAFLHLACPQPVYRWFNGRALPTVDHLYALSKLFHIHMEDMIKINKKHQVNEAYFDIMMKIENYKKWMNFQKKLTVNR